jgi:broad specificity phosphatase PhoE
MGENDRSSTGFLPPALFEIAADRFFANPQQSHEGWERAIDAQARIVATVGTALASVPPGTPAILCGHGGVGTLLKCFVGGYPIGRDQDQGRTGGTGGGNGFVFDWERRELLLDWTPLESIAPDWFTAPTIARAKVLT